MKDISLVDCINRIQNTRRRNASFERKIKRISKLICDFEAHEGITIYPNSFDDDMSERFIRFIRSSKKLRGKGNYKSGTVQSFINDLKAILVRFDRKGEKIRLDALKELSIPKDESATVYLSMQEIGRINTLHLHNDSAQVRDIFIVGCLTGLRYSDYSRLSEDNFVNGNIEITTQKTNTRVVIPVHPIISHIIERNNGYGFLNYKKSQQNFNLRIKYICRKAGITDKVYSERIEGFDRVRRVHKKYELISSHTARRSCATNMYLAGVPIARIMLITGHKTEQSFFSYIRIGKEENAEVLKNHPYFQRY